MTRNEAGDEVVRPEGQWSTGFFNCCDEPFICVKACFCPCITMGQVVEIVDRGTTSSGTACEIIAGLQMIHCSWKYTTRYRSKLRALFKLPEEPYGDQTSHCCCCVCAITQEYRELKNRGADPSIGWEGNVEKWRREGAIVPPFFPSEMSRD